MCLSFVDTTLAYTPAFSSAGRSTFESLPLGKEWLNSCREQHKACRVQGTRWLPTRLLDITKKRIRLKDNTQMLALRKQKYATLSHCWGKAQVLKLETSTLKLLRKGIDIGQLPLSFRHAVQVARYLGLRYLWIDSLCILQDNKKDWSHESALMYKVYSKSHINIAATAARDSRDGLFFIRDPDIELLPVCVTLPDVSRYTGGVETTYTVVSIHGLSEEVEKAPLTRRGWVLQERLLAPRVLHFGPKQLIWECQEKLLCERHPNRLPPDVKVDRSRNIKEAFIKDGMPKRPFETYWEDLVAEYTRASITIPSDKSVAFSGIVKHMQTKTKDEYVAGMWRSQLPWSLTWFVHMNSRKVSSRAFPYRAPTWSWLSVDGQISVNISREPGNIFYVEVLDIQMRYAHSDPTREIDSGRLYLRGNLRQAKILLTDSTEDRYGFRFTLELKSGPLLKSHKYMDFQLDVWQPDFAENNDNDELYVMPCCGPAAENTHNMLLLKCVDAKNGEFERLGTLWFSALWEYPTLLPTILAHDDDEDSIPCAEFDAVKRLHTIVLI